MLNVLKVNLVINSWANKFVHEICAIWMNTSQLHHHFWIRLSSQDPSGTLDLKDIIDHSIVKILPGKISSTVSILCLP